MLGPLIFITAGPPRRPFFRGFRTGEREANYGPLLGAESLVEPLETRRVARKLSSEARFRSPPISFPARIPRSSRFAPEGLSRPSTSCHGSAVPDLRLKRSQPSQPVGRNHKLLMLFPCWRGRGGQEKPPLPPKPTPPQNGFPSFTLFPWGLSCRGYNRYALAGCSNVSFRVLRFARAG